MFTEVSLILAALFWGGNHAATKYATDFVPPLLFVVLRFTLAAALGLEKPGWGGVLGVALSIAGVAVVVRGGLGTEGTSLGGDALILLAAVCVGGYTVLSIPLLQRHSPLEVACYPTLFAAPIVLVLSMTVGASLEWGEMSVGAWVAVL